jgi:hypothetical protein
MESPLEYVGGGGGYKAEVSMESLLEYVGHHVERVRAGSFSG